VATSSTFLLGIFSESQYAEHVHRPSGGGPGSTSAGSPASCPDHDDLGPAFLHLDRRFRGLHHRPCILTGRNHRSADPDRCRGFLRLQRVRHRRPVQHPQRGSELTPARNLILPIARCFGCASQAGASDQGQQLCGGPRPQDHHRSHPPRHCLHWCANRVPDQERRAAGDRGDCHRRRRRRGDRRNRHAI
ncbi:hypothetical protein GQ53DRAFT_808904, partial [Thozetella sp. PMI_491]